MGRKSVAVLDIRSSEVTVVLAERGVNHTFVFRGKDTEPYDGYADGEFYDKKNLEDAIVRALATVERSSMEKIRSIAVGVPGEFSDVLIRRHLFSFQSRRKVTERDINKLYEDGYRNHEGAGYLIRRSGMYFETSDKRKSIDPVGMLSNSLEGALSYYVCHPYFHDTLEDILNRYGIREIDYIPSSYAQVMYLFTGEQRDGYALLLDVGYISHTFSVAYGNGIFYERSASEGGAHIAARISEKYDLPFYAAEKLVGKVNLSARGEPGAVVEVFDEDRVCKVPAERLREYVKDELDVLCEYINRYLEDCPEKNIAQKPIWLTGGGLSHIRGAKEHMSKRLNRVVDSIAPTIPYYNKESQSSFLSVLDMALSDSRKGGMLSKILNGFGG